MRKRLLLALVSFACLGLGYAGFLAATAPCHHIGRERFDRIKHGMTPIEVEEILGPPGNYGPPGHEPVSWMYEGGVGGNYGIPKYKDVETWTSWRAGKVSIHIGFDSDDRVVVTRYDPDRALREESLPDKLRRWLRLPF
ncbi:MAG: hypothetical protein HY040_16515 [Planctomycetes bacterium]|nr:hypothetical protein [Planctomycetota bacterium]